MNGFTIYKEYYELITLLTEKEQQELLLAIVKYMFEDTIPALNNKQMKIFKNLKRPLDTSKKNSKRSKGYGAPTGNQNARKKQTKNQTENNPKTNQKTNQIISKKQTHQDVNVIVSNYDSNYVVNVNDNVNVNSSSSCYKKNNNITNNSNSLNNSNSISLYNYLEENYGRTLSSIEFEKIDGWVKNFSEELIKYAIQISVLNNKKNLNYVNGILNNWKSSNLKTIEEVKENEVKRINSNDYDKNAAEILDYNWFEEMEKKDDI